MGELVRVNLIFFAKSREIVGKKEVQLLVPSTCSGRQLINYILLEYPELRLISNSIVLSLNEEYLESDRAVSIQNNDELAVIPPISEDKRKMNYVDIVEEKLKVDEVTDTVSSPSCGAISIFVADKCKRNYVGIKEEKLKVDEATDMVSSPSCGAISIFVGTTRDNFEGKRVVQLDYEAYDTVAEKKMLEVCTIIREKWDVHNIAIIHRIGVVPVKEASIIIAISSAHRKESLEAVQFAIETVSSPSCGAISIFVEDKHKLNYVDIVEEKLKVDEVTDMVSSPSCGAISIFVGTTRDNFEGKRVVQLDYEAYDTMAKKKMYEVCTIIREKWDVHNIAIIHRIGVVPVKEASIIIAISSVHRKESLEAVQFAIETVKAVVPVWKKEEYDDDTFSWKQNKECVWSSVSKTSSNHFIDDNTSLEKS